MLSTCAMGYKRKIAITALCLALTFSEDMLKAYNDRSYKRASAPIQSDKLPIAQRVLPADSACFGGKCSSDAAPEMQNCVVHGNVIYHYDLVLRIGKQLQYVRTTTCSIKTTSHCCVMLMYALLRPQMPSISDCALVPSVKQKLHEHYKNNRIILSLAFIVHADGMRCEGCRRGVINAIHSIEGVRSVDVSLQSQIAVIDTLHGNSNKSLLDKKLIAERAVAAIQKAGFEATHVTNSCKTH
jgi:copper chaperone CopZ